MADRARQVGLALSGGGFRAAFFHVGVLAQLARLGVLRHVEVLSTVSGGSLIGALYYLHLKRLLEAKPDRDVTDQDYIAIVKKLEVDFFNAVQTNFRVRAFLNPLSVLRTALPSYSRTDRMGYLYDKYIYRPAFDPQRTTPIQLRELLIQPAGGPATFNPQEHNAGRSARVPMLLINATSLNTGHNWRFEAARMGEPERTGAIADDIDKTFRLRRFKSWDQVPEHPRTIPLGLAVAASACVPGVFPPLAVSGLYDKGVRVQLVDGGVHDNQGIQGLLDQGCTHLIVSDATKQYRASIDPAIQILPLLFRATDVFLTRVREEQLFRILEPERRPVAFIHLFEGISGEGISWLDPQGKPAQAMQAERGPEVPAEDFGVARPVQEALSKIRTDLDSFTEVEANALMLDGYRVSAAELQRTEGFKPLVGPAESDEAHAWTFLAIDPWMRRPNRRFRRRLAVARENSFKFFRLNWLLVALLILGLVGAIGWWAYHSFSWTVFWDQVLTRPISLGWLLGAVLVVGFVLIPELTDTSWVPSYIREPIEVTVRFIFRLPVALIASMTTAIHLGTVEPLHQWQGRIARLGRPPKSAPPAREPEPEEPER